MTLPLISVLMPVRNGGEHLFPAVNSILQQSLSALELIVVDDHSSDGAVNRLAEQCGHDARLKIAHNPGRGVSAACNHAASLANAQLLARMDGDDIALPERLARQYEYLQQHPELGLCGAEVDIFTDKGTAAGGYQRYQHWINQLHEPAEIAASLYVESPIPNPTAVFHRAVYEQLGGYHDSPWHEDYDLYLRAHHLGIRMGKPKGVLLRWRDHQQRSTRNQNRYKQTQLTACKAYYLAQHELRGRPVIICGGGPVALALHDALIEQSVEILGFIDVAPGRIGQQKRGKPVWGIEAITATESNCYLAAVGQPGRRQAINQLFLQCGLRAQHDFILCA